MTGLTLGYTYRHRLSIAYLQLWSRIHIVPLSAALSITHSYIIIFIHIHSIIQLVYTWTLENFFVKPSYFLSVLPHGDVRTWKTGPGVRIRMVSQVHFWAYVMLSSISTPSVPFACSFPNLHFHFLFPLYTFCYWLRRIIWWWIAYLSVCQCLWKLWSGSSNVRGKRRLPGAPGLLGIH